MSLFQAIFGSFVKKFIGVPLTCESNPCNNYSVHPDEFGGV